MRKKRNPVSSSDSFITLWSNPARSAKRKSRDIAATSWNRRHTTRWFKRLESANTLLERFVNTHVYTICVYMYIKARSQTSSGAFVTTLDPHRAPTCTPCLYRATNCLRNENIVPVNKWLHCAGRAVLFVITNRSLRGAWPLETQAHAIKRGGGRERERRAVCFG